MAPAGARVGFGWGETFTERMREDQTRSIDALIVDRGERVAEPGM
jgi:hypothetical protein